MGKDKSSWCENYGNAILQILFVVSVICVTICANYHPDPEMEHLFQGLVFLHGLTTLAFILVCIKCPFCSKQDTDTDDVDVESDAAVVVMVDDEEQQLLNSDKKDEEFEILLPFKVHFKTMDERKSRF